VDSRSGSLLLETRGEVLDHFEQCLNVIKQRVQADELFADATVSHCWLTTVLTTKMTTFRLPGTSTYTTIELVSCLVAPSARADGSEG
jgi:hypothetical protein